MHIKLSDDVFFERDADLLVQSMSPDYSEAID